MCTIRNKACIANSGSPDPFVVGKVDDLDEMCNLHAGDHSGNKCDTPLLFETLVPLTASVRTA